MLPRTRIRWTITITTTLFGLLLLIPGVAAAAAWLSPVPLNTSGASEPSVAMDSPGDAFIAWQAPLNNALGVSIVRAAYQPVGAGAFAPLPDVSPDPFNDNTSPLVVTNGAGNGLVTWIHATGFMANEEVLARTISPGGAVGAVQTIASNGGNYTGLAAAIDANGDVVLAWLHNSANVQAVNRQGLIGTFGMPTTLDGTATSAPSVALDGTGDAIVVWPTALGIDAKRQPAGGSWTAMPDQVTDGGGHVYSSPVVAANPTGQMVVAFMDAFSGNTVAAVSGAVSGGWGISPAVTTLSESGVTHGPALNVDDNGGAAVGWTTSSAVQVSLRPAGGSFPAPGNAQTIPTSTPDTFALGGNGAGDLVIAWSLFDMSVVQNVVLAAVEPHGASSFSAAHTVSDPTMYSSSPVIAVDQGGDAVLGMSLGALPLGVSTAVYDATPPVLGTPAGPASVNQGTAANFSVQASDAFSPVSVSWSFGDGSPAVSGTSVSHTFQSPGTFTVTATATDTAGNAASVARSIAVSRVAVPPPKPKPKPAPPRCRVPKLKGKTLSQARTLLRRAHCKVGKVHKPTARKHQKLRKLVVSRTSPGAKASRPSGTKVGITLVQVPKSRPKKPTKH